MNLKHISIKGTHNLRDLGGFPVEGGGTCWNILYRSDSLHSLSEGEWKALEERNLKSIIDLRSLPEVRAKAITPPTSIKYYHFSLMKNLDDIPALGAATMADIQRVGVEKIMESMKLDYIKTIRQNPETCVAVLDCISEGLKEGAVLFLCSAGKDRTGIVAALLLDLAGVSEEDIVADYAVSAIYNAKGINRMVENLPEELNRHMPPEAGTMLKHVFDSKPETMKRFLDALHGVSNGEGNGEREPSLWNVLKEHGFTDEKKETLRQQIIESF